MERTSNKKTYKDFISHYQALVTEYNELDEELGEIKFSLKPSEIKRRRDLKKDVDELYDEICDMEDFATETLTFDRAVVVDFMTRFYSSYFNQELKAIDFMDNRDSKYAVKATIIVTARDYAALNRKFKGFEQAVNSDDVVESCEGAFLFLAGEKTCELYDGVYLNKQYKDFKEIDEVLERALTYAIQNKTLTNVQCLQMALSDYLREKDILHGVPVFGTRDKYGAPISGTGDRYSAPYEDTEMDAEIAATVRAVVEEEKAEKAASTQRILSMLDCIDPKVVAENAEKLRREAEQQARQTRQAQPAEPVRPFEPVRPARPVRPAQQTPAAQASRETSSVLNMLDNVVPFERLGDVHTTSTVPREGYRAPQARPVQPVRPVRPASAMRVTGAEAAPAAKQTQYNATTQVLLDMLGQMTQTPEEDQGLRRK